MGLNADSASTLCPRHTPLSLHQGVPFPACLSVCGLTELGARCLVGAQQRAAGPLALLGGAVPEGVPVLHQPCPPPCCPWCRAAENSKSGKSQAGPPAPSPACLYCSIPASLPLLPPSATSSGPSTAVWP